MTGIASVELETHAEVVPVVVVALDSQDQESPSVLEPAEDVGEVPPSVLEAQMIEEPGDDVAPEVASDEAWLVEKEPDDTSTEVEKEDEPHGEPPNDEGERTVEVTCNVAALDVGAVELAPEVVMVVPAEEREVCEDAGVSDDPIEGTIITGGTPLDATWEEEVVDDPGLV